jgi:hypothetical protein
MPKHLLLAAMFAAVFVFNPGIVRANALQSPVCPSQQKLCLPKLAQSACQGVPYCGNRAPVCVQYAQPGCCVRWTCAF